MCSAWNRLDRHGDMNQNAYIVRSSAQKRAIKVMDYAGSLLLKLGEMKLNLVIDQSECGQ